MEVDTCFSVLNVQNVRTDIYQDCWLDLFFLQNFMWRHFAPRGLVLLNSVDVLKINKVFMLGREIVVFKWLFPNWKSFPKVLINSSSNASVDTIAVQLRLNLSEPPSFSDPTKRLAIDSFLEALIFCFHSVFN